jgi:hypothetical protein
MTATPARAFSNRLIASPYHTVGLLGLIIALSLITRLFVTSRPATTLRTEHLQVYLLGFSWDWLLFLYVRFGLKRRGVRTIRQVLDDRDWTFVRWLLHLAIAVGLAFLWEPLGSLWEDSSISTRNKLPAYEAYSPVVCWTKPFG